MKVNLPDQENEVYFKLMHHNHFNRGARTNMESIRALEPKAVWEIFAMICAIPHPSGQEAKLAGAIAELASQHSLRVRRDAYGNLRIDRPASPGFEERPAVILQGHLDMVPQAAPETKFDFATDPIPAAAINGFVRSTAETTLGADNGLGVAAALALLFDESFRSGPLAAVFTLSEEVGLNGALALDPAFLAGEYLLNLDSEEEGELYVGCAGGARLEAELPLEFEATPPGLVGAVLEVKGLAGGHSGCNIADRRGNAVRFLGEALRACPQLRAASALGGSLDNAIPREAKAAVAFDPADRGTVEKQLAALERKFRGECALPAAFAVALADAPRPERVWTRPVRERVAEALAGCPDGVLEMDSRFGIPRTSANLAAVFERGGGLVFRTSQRSFSDAGRREASARVAAHFTKLGGTAKLDNEYPGWEPAANSKLLGKAVDLYTELFGETPRVKVIHAGLECGIFAGKRPNLDMLSFGPTILDPHSPSERVEIAGVERFYSFLGALVSAL